MQILIDDLLVQYDAYGKESAPPVIILHGWADASISWRQFARALSDTYYVVVPNLPGFGGSDVPPDAWGLDEYARFVQHFLRKLAIVPVALVGHSNGGAIAIRGLATGLLEVDKLVLLASAGIRTIATGSKRFMRLLAKTGKIVTYPLPGRIKSRLRKRLYTSIGSDLLIAEHMQATFKRIVAQDVQRDAVELSLPVLLVYGDSDTATPPLFGRQFHEHMPQSTLEIIKAGHFIQLDAPAQTVKLVREFLR